MKKELDDKLCQDFPLLYTDRHASLKESLMPFGFECGDGWYELIYNLSIKLEAIISQKQDYNCRCGHSKNNHIDSGCMTTYETHDDAYKCNCEKYKSDHPRASQVKEKFGGLRFYTNYSLPEMEALIDEAEELSTKTCESCGAPGILRGKGWVYTACDECEASYQKKKVSKNNDSK